MGPNSSMCSALDCASAQLGASAFGSGITVVSELQLVPVVQIVLVGLLVIPA